MSIVLNNSVQTCFIVICTYPFNDTVKKYKLKKNNGA